MSVPSTPLANEFRTVAEAWSRSLVGIVRLAAAFADSSEWVLACSPSAAHQLAAIADVETSTAREWIRIGRLLKELPASADAFESGQISYSKLRSLTRIVTPQNETELLEKARNVPAGQLKRALASWLSQNSDPEQLDAYQQSQRSVSEQIAPDGMTTVIMRLPPLVAGAWSASLTAAVAQNRPRLSGASADAWPTLAQQKVDALELILAEGTGRLSTEIVLHVRGDGCSLDNGTPIPDTVIERIAPGSFLRALIHDANSRPINASGRQRHPSTRQKRVVKEREKVCIDCGRAELLQFDHDPQFEETGHTVVDELRVRCAPCHQRRHAA